MWGTRSGKSLLDLKKVRQPVQVAKLSSMRYNIMPVFIQEAVGKDVRSIAGQCSSGDLGSGFIAFTGATSFAQFDIVIKTTFI